MFTNNQNSNIFSNNNNNNIFANNNNYSNNSNNNYNSNNNNSYGYNTRNSTNNSNNNNNNNNNNSNTLLRGTNEQPHQNFIKQLLGFIEDFQKSQELHCLKNILENQYKQTQKDLQICSQHQNSFLYDELFSKEIRERCLNIKNNNDLIILEFFNFKQKMSKINSSSLDKDMTKEHEYSQIHEKIRKTKMQILNKFQKVRNARQAEQAKKKFNQKMKKQNQIPVARVALDELSNLVGIVNRELIKQKEEIRVLIKQLYDEDL